MIVCMKTVSCNIKICAWDKRFQDSCILEHGWEGFFPWFWVSRYDISCSVLNTRPFGKNYIGDNVKLIQNKMVWKGKLFFPFSTVLLLCYSFGEREVNIWLLLFILLIEWCPLFLFISLFICSHVLSH